MESFPTLYKKKVLPSGKVKLNFWKISVEETDEGKVFIVRVWGAENGKAQVKRNEILDGKNKGKKNETSKKVQAIREAAALWKDYHDVKQYNQDRDEALVSDLIIPMTAYLLKDMSKVAGKKMIMQIKYDGVRTLVNFADGKITLYSRSLVETYDVPHISTELIAGLKNLGEKFYLDGELISDEYPLWEFAGALRRERGIDEVEKVIKSMYLIAYDCFDLSRPSLPYHVRHDIISKEFGELYNTVIVENHVATTENQIKKFFDEAVKNGEEGIMLREPNCAYEHKRSNCLLKLKGTTDKDYIIVDVIPSDNEPGARLVLKTDAGLEFTVRPSGSEAYRIALLGRKKELIGKKVTVTFANLTDNDIPFHPRIKDVLIKI